ncbi:MAG: ARMT1-like domain-containing protein [Thermodesulfobacteriota bacterium]
MLLKPDCIPCILKMSASAIRKLTDDEEVLKELTIKILQIPALRGLDWDLSSPEVIEQVMGKMIETFQTPDPFKDLKAEQNQRGLELYPHLQHLIQESTDPLFTAVLLAIQGNAIDLMVSDRSIEVEKALGQELQQPIDEKSFLAFRDKLEKARLLVYLGDNSGEIVFDRILIETIRSLVDLEVVFVVRNFPALNDVTLREAEQIGMDQIARVITNGLEAPVPGTILSRCSSEFRDLFQKADLIISKGGGNFDSLEEEKSHSKDITFMLLSKCLPYGRYFQTRMYQPILANFFH